MIDIPKLFRVTVEVANLDEAATFYATLFNTDGKRHPGARHYFDCGGVILAVLDVSQGGMNPTPGPKSLYFAVTDLDAGLVDSIRREPVGDGWPALQLPGECRHQRGPHRQQ